MASSRDVSPRKKGWVYLLLALVIVGSFLVRYSLLRVFDNTRQAEDSYWYARIVDELSAGCGRGGCTPFTAVLKYHSLYVILGYLINLLVGDPMLSLRLISLLSGLASFIILFYLNSNFNTIPAVNNWLAVTGLDC